jgi:hypothetical protein
MRILLKFKNQWKQRFSVCRYKLYCLYSCLSGGFSEKLLFEGIRLTAGRVIRKLPKRQKPKKICCFSTERVCIYIYIYKIKIYIVLKYLFNIPIYLYMNCFVNRSLQKYV